jgi:2-C-methyl-D-erythritol 4-phosphate cytidylyltransferase/2-C-methyl-D-erythritol 2,4-cyclodiphosphate synthase
LTGGTSFVLVAAGRGKRFGGQVPKQYSEAAGHPLWEWSARLAEALSLQSNVDELVLVVSPKDLESLSGDIPAFRIPLTLAVGGEERSISVMNGLMAAKGEVVLVHDAARPLASEHLCRELLRKVHLTGGAIPVLPVADALKRVTLEGLETVNREDLYRAQTPQAFAREDLIDALKRFGRGARDESEAWNASGRQVTLVAGEATNIKVTYPEDLALAKMLLSGHLEWRTGHGYDIHPLVPGRPLVLGGIKVPSRLGLNGHSDADCLCHAASDALLGGVGLPDIGILFPATDPRYKDAFSLSLFREAARKVREEGWTIRWIDLTLIAQVPRLGNLVEEMKVSMESALACPSGIRHVNIKVKSGEGIGAAGEAQCMECHAVATLSRKVSFAEPTF